MPSRSEKGGILGREDRVVELGRHIFIELCRRSSGWQRSRDSAGEARADLFFQLVDECLEQDTLVLRLARLADATESETDNADRRRTRHRRDTLPVLVPLALRRRCKRETDHFCSSAGGRQTQPRALEVNL